MKKVNPKPFFRKTFFLGKEFFYSDSVYEPGKDSFLLSESASIPEGSKVLDLGCGTGIQGINAFMKGAEKVFFADINPEALKCAEKNALLAGMKKGKNFELIKSDLFSEMKKKKSGLFSSKKNSKKKFDVILFNPPYVLSEGINKSFHGKEKENKPKHLALDGGKKGRELLDKFLDKFPNHLNPGGRIYFIQSSLNGLKKSKQLLLRKGFSCVVIARKRLFFEELLVVTSKKVLH